MPRPPRARLTVTALEDRSTPASFAVTNLADAGAGSLRAAIDAANAAPDADTIVFDAAVKGGTVGLTTFSNPEASTADNPMPVGPTALVVTSAVIIRGTGETVTRAGSDAFRLFQVTPAGNLTLENLTLSNGLARGGKGANGAAGMGGAVYNQGTVTVAGCTLTGNQAIGGAGGGSGGGGGLGGDAAGATGGGPNGGPPVTSAGFGGGGGLGRSGVPSGDPSNPIDSYGTSGGSGGFGGGGGAGGVSYLWGRLSSPRGAGPLVRQAYQMPTGLSGFGGGASGGGGGEGMGGAVFNQGGAVALVNSTVVGNTARGGDATYNGCGYGGGLFNLNGSVTVTHATFAGNVVALGTGHLGTTPHGTDLANYSYPVGDAAPRSSATATLANSILASGGYVVSSFQGTGPATVDARGPNIVVGTAYSIQGAPFTGTPFTVADPKLGALAANGGPTRTMLPAAGSPAVDAGGPVAGGPTTDQRGYSRVAGSRPDLGAVEVGGLPAAPPAAVTAFAVNRGQAQRSIVRTLDVTLDSPAAAAALLGAGRLKLVKRDLSGNNPAAVTLARWMLSAAGGVLTVNFGAQGLGGSRNSATADGYYTLEMDLDGDGTREAAARFYRLLGDTNGDRRVDQADVDRVTAGVGRPLAPDLDANGDGVVNSTDKLSAQRNYGRALAAGLPLDG